MKKLWFTIVGILALIFITLGLLSFGNPQWGKWVYCWQAYFWPSYDEELIKGVPVKDNLGLERKCSLGGWRLFRYRGKSFNRNKILIFFGLNMLVGFR